MGWIKDESIPGGWLVRCSLCGKDFTRTFIASNTNYADAEKQSRKYHQDHLGSTSHRAALEVYYAEEVPEEGRQEKVMREIFGGEAPTEKQLRKNEARLAAYRNRAN